MKFPMASSVIKMKMMMVMITLGGSSSSLFVRAVANGSSSLSSQAAFRRISTFHICEQLDPTCNTDTQTNAETIWYYLSDSSPHLVYTDSEAGNLGFVDISDPSSPNANGFVALGGEPTTVRVIGDYGACVRCVFVSCLCISCAVCVAGMLE